MPAPRTEAGMGRRRGHEHAAVRAGHVSDELRFRRQLGLGIRLGADKVFRGISVRRRLAIDPGAAPPKDAANETDRDHLAG